MNAGALLGIRWESLFRPKYARVEQVRARKPTENRNGGRSHRSARLLGQKGQSIDAQREVRRGDERLIISAPQGQIQSNRRGELRQYPCRQRSRSHQVEEMKPELRSGNVWPGGEKAVQLRT